MRFYWLVLGVLAVWRVTHLFNAEDGPANVMVRLRRLAGSGFFGSLLDCFYCLSVWVAVPFVFLTGDNWKERLLLWPALSAGAILLERTGSREPAPPIFYQEELPDGLLRKESTPVSDINPDPE